jgi:hypothetical protein
VPDADLDVNDLASVAELEEIGTIRELRRRQQRAASAAAGDEPGGTSQRRAAQV